MISKSFLTRIDRQDMFRVLYDFPVQVCEAVDIAGKVKTGSLNAKNIKNIVINGLGGSAIGGDLLRSYTAPEMKVPVFVNRNYTLPAFADKDTLAVISSYSGNTEETTSAFKDALKKKCRIVCISSGGLVEEMAKKHKKLLIKIPGGLQPRCALGYSFFSLLILFTKLNFIKDKSKDINETLLVLEDSLEELTDLSFDTNPALRLAAMLKDRLPVIYSAVDTLDVVNLRWRGQISENAKILCYGNLYPEMNHNELVGWELNKDLLNKINVIFLEDPSDNLRIKMRMKITERILKRYAANIIHLSSDCKSRLARIFDLIYLGDWVSYYLAILNRVNPTPVNAISYLKKELEKHL